jgi:archaellum biogenesis ATPase FlaH
VTSDEEDEQLSDEELRDLMGPAAASCIGRERDTEKEDREWKKRRDAIVDEHTAKSALSVKPARDAMSDAASTTPALPPPRHPKAGATPPLAGGELRNKQLFGEFWREGELVVLTGASGTGKSILAMQIAEAAAAWRAKNPPWPKELEGEDPAEVPQEVVDLYRGLEPATRVLYVDLERSEKQRTERYSVAVNSGQLTVNSERGGAGRATPLGDAPAGTPVDARVPAGSQIRTYEFSENLDWADVALFGHMHSKYKGNATKFFVASVYEEMQRQSTDVVIIDNLTFLVSSGRHMGEEMRSLMKTLRRWVNDTGTSIMLLAHSERWRGRAVIRGKADFHPALELADRVFALMPSSLGPSFRYVKTVFPANSAPWTADDPVEGYELGRSTTQPEFLGFEHLRQMPEDAHLRNYATHVEMVRRAVTRVEERWGGRRRKLRAAVPSTVVFKGIETV